MIEKEEAYKWFIIGIKKALSGIGIIAIDVSGRAIIDKQFEEIWEKDKK